MRLNIFILAVILIVSLVSPLNLMYRGEGTSPLGSVHFTKIDDNENGTKWIGGYNGETEAKVDKLRISLYDEHKNLKETGLISDYFQNKSFGYFIVIINSNNNSRLDPGDIIFLYESGEVESIWGIVVTYEPSGNLIAINTIDGKKFQLDNEEEKDSFPQILFIIVALSIGVLLIILGYKLPKKE